jgi:hypothetical protein
MSNNTLSELLKFYREDRPYGWVMDRFIRKAEELEKQLNKIIEVNEFCQKRGIWKIGESAVYALMQRHDELVAQVERLTKEVAGK